MPRNTLGRVVTAAIMLLLALIVPQLIPEAEAAERTWFASQSQAVSQEDPGERRLPFLTEVQRKPEPRTAEEVIRDFRTPGKHWVPEEDFLAELRKLNFRVERLEDIRRARVRYCYPPEKIRVQHAIFRAGKHVGFGWRVRECRIGEPIFQLSYAETGEWCDAFSGDCGNTVAAKCLKPKPKVIVKDSPPPQPGPEIRYELAPIVPPEGANMQYCYHSGGGELICTYL